MKIAEPPIINISIAFLNTFPLNFLALIAPKTPRKKSEKKIDVLKAEELPKNMYGDSGINPAKKYEINIIKLDLTSDRWEAGVCSLSLNTECSDRKLPTPIENASTKINTTPVNTMVDDGVSAMAIPESKPTVETKESSTPKTKLRKCDELLIGMSLIIAEKLVGVLRIELRSHAPHARILPLNYTP